MKNWTLATLSFLCAGLYSLPAYSASFDCKKASTYVEELICTSSILSDQDEKVAKQYKDDIAKARQDENDSVERIRTNQMRWLTFQRNTCEGEGCLMREYNERLGCTEDCGNEYSRGDLVDDKAFGIFVGSSEASIDYSNNKTSEDAQDKNNRLNIMRVGDRPSLAVIDMWLTFKNGHSCSVDEHLVRWAQNHWKLEDNYNGVKTELRFYPTIDKGKNMILVRDIDNNYMKVNCGMRGYFDGQMFEKK